MIRRVPPLGIPMMAVLALGLLGACSSTGAEGDAYVETPVGTLYNDATDALRARQYVTAAAKFDEVERQHPYSVWATKSQIMAAYSHYQQNDYVSAVVALDRFIQLHPAHRDIPYAYYLKGLSYYERISDVARDQKMTTDARRTFEELIVRYPNSRYARDARIKLDLTLDHLAGKEMEIGRYYITQGHYLAAINRFNAVIRNFQTTTHVPEALHRLIEAYTALGIPEEARRTAAVLGHNFPGSEWYKDSYGLVEGKEVRPPEEKAWYQLW